LFDPLKRGPTAAATGEATSMGLGLFIVREVVLAHGGAVEARSGDGRTCFEILLPRRAGDALPEAG
jgi:signal transduction histidine kinase